MGCELNHQLAAFAIDALGELGVLYDGSPHLRATAAGSGSYMFDLGLIIGGGTAQIQKNIIAERGLGMPREPKSGEGGGASPRSGHRFGLRPRDKGLKPWNSLSPPTRR